MPNLLSVQLSVIEIERYAVELIDLLESLSEDQIWFADSGIPNSIGIIARHLTGNLNHYLGAGILKNGYIRDRDREFKETNIPKQQIISDLQAAVRVTKEAVEAIDQEKVNKPYRTPCGQEFESLAYHVVRLVTHFAHHCGQADYAKNFVTR
jgi:hypothetical protein